MSRVERFSHAKGTTYLVLIDVEGTVCAAGSGTVSAGKGAWAGRGGSGMGPPICGIGTVGLLHVTGVLNEVKLLLFYIHIRAPDETPKTITPVAMNE